MTAVAGKAGGSDKGIWTPANIVTLVRICLVPLFVVVMVSPWPEWLSVHDVVDDQAKSLIAAGVFVVISCTDWVDGYLARSRGEVTDFGKFIDPLADKILVAAALIALVELQVIPSWPVLIILTREFIVSGIRMIAASKGVVIAASWYGKAKTVLQILAIVLFIVKDSFVVPNPASAIENPLYIVSWIVMGCALFMTVLSMLDYIAKARPILFPTGEDASDAREDGFSTERGAGSGDASTGERAFETSEGIAELSREVVSAAARKEVRIATAESLTGGLIASALTSVPGSSDVLNGGLVTYVNEAKHRLLGVDETLLRERGAVDAEVARQMAAGAAARLGADVAVSVTGIAGPGGAEPGKPVGTVFMGVCVNGEATSSRLSLVGNRSEIREKTVACALRAVKDALEDC